MIRLAKETNHNNHVTALRIRTITQSTDEEPKKSYVNQIRSCNHVGDSSDLVASLKACAKKKDLCKGILLHDSIIRNGLLETSPCLASSLINMYAKCGMFEDARKVIEERSVQNIQSWNALISGYIQQGQSLLALNCFEKMQRDGGSPNVVTYTCILKACGKTGCVDMGEKIHDEVVSKGLLGGGDVMLGNTLVDMYVKFGQLGKAQVAFEELPVRNVVSWNTLISGYSQNGQGHEALKCYEGMQCEGLFPDEVTFICMLKACGSVQDAKKGEVIHDEIFTRGLLKKDIAFGNAVVDMYVKCGMLDKAQLVLKELPSRNVLSWNSLIAGYAQQGQCYEALNCLVCMQDEGLSPNAITYTYILKVCGNTGAIDKGKKIHEKIATGNLLRDDIVLGNALIDMYAKCGELSKALQVFECQPVKDMISWNILVSGYVQQDEFQNAVDCYERMQNEGLVPDSITFTCILHACGSNTGAFDKAKKIHNEIVNRGLLEKNIVLGNGLVDMYAKLGFLTKAEKVLRELPARNVVTWSALMAGYVEHGQSHDALCLLERMQSEGLSPDFVTYIYILKACGNTKNIEKGEQVHSEVIQKGLLETDIVLGNALIDMYIKCGMIAKAQNVLDKLHMRDVISWNEMIVGYAQCGQCVEALNCFEQMQSEGFSPDSVTYICALKACGTMGAIERGEAIHHELMDTNFLKNSVPLGNALLDMYIKCGVFGKAQEVLDELPVRNTSTWNALISGYSQHGQAHDALHCYRHMQNEGFIPDAITFTCILKACGQIKALDEGENIYGKVVSQRLLKKDAAIGNALIDMYIKCGALAKARHVLEELPVRDVIAWNEIIAGYQQHGEDREALTCFERMQNEGHVPDTVTFICTLKACANIGSVDMGEKLHEKIVLQGLLGKDIILGNALMDMYSKCGVILKAREVLEELPFRDVISWNTLITGYAQLDEGHEALDCFQKMQDEGIPPDVVTFICILKVCGSAGAIEKSKAIHEEIESRGLLKRDIMLGNALVDMYAKCGMLARAEQTLDELPTRNAVSWSAVIMGYAQQGQGCEALNSFKRMQTEGIHPDEVTYLCILSACCHSGLLTEALTLFENMKQEYGILPKLEHHTCMVMVLGGAGCFDEAISAIGMMPSADHLAIWLTLLGACRKWGNLKLGRIAFDQALKLDDGCGAAYMLMADILASTGMRDDAECIEAHMRSKKICSFE